MERGKDDSSAVLQAEEMNTGDLVEDVRTEPTAAASQLPVRSTGEAGLPDRADGGMSRRRFLALSGAAAGTIVGGGLLGAGCPVGDEDEEETTTTTAEDAAGLDHTGEGAAATFTLVSLATSEAEALEALLARMIPSDDVGPGAVEAGVVRYIDRALGSEAAEQLDFMRANLAAVDEFARQEQNQNFRELQPEVQDELVGAIERGEAEGFTPSAPEFFAAVRELALQGMFGDPFYGGNIDRAGWDLIQFPGIRLEVPAENQELEAEQSEGRASVYEFDAFGLQRQEGE